MDNPFEMAIYDRDLKFSGFVVDPIYCNFVPAWKSQGYGQFMVTSDNPHIDALMEEGARVGVKYRGRHLMSGPLRSYQGDLVKNTAVTFQLLDDRRMLENTLLWVNPYGTLEPKTLDDMAQAWRPDGGPGTPGTVAGQYGYYLWPDGSAAAGGLYVGTTEAAIKNVIEANILKRLGRPITIAPDLGRGGDPRSILPRLRFAPLSEVMTPLTKFSGLGITFQQRWMEETITVDVVEPGEWTAPITPESGIITEGTYSVNAPNVTRPIVGGPGETSARAFYGKSGKGRLTDWEQRYNDVIEVLRDATGLQLNWPSTLADAYRVAKYYPLQAAANDVAAYYSYMQTEEAAGLSDGAPTTGLSVTLSETDTFHFGGTDGVQLGDKVTVMVNGAPITDVVTEAQITFTRDNGLKVAPIVGERQDDPDEQFAKAINALTRALRSLSASK